MKDIDKGYRALRKRLNEFKKSVIKVGIQGKEAQAVNDGVTVVTYAAANEFGTTTAGKNNNITIPERSFIRSTTDKKNYWKKSIENAYTSIVDGKDTALSAIAKVGIIARDDIKQTITDGVPPPNAESTIKRKSVNGKIGNHTLIDTGIMRNSVSYKFSDDDGY